MTERSLQAVPRIVLTLGMLLLALQIGLRTTQPAPTARAEDLPPPPSSVAARLASLGEPITLAGLTALRLQAFDNQPGVSLPFAALDYAKLGAWLDLMLDLDPRANYPLLMASHLYAQVPDPARQRLMLDFTYRQFLLDPERRWRYLAHAALIAKHRLHDLPLALDYARAIQEKARGTALHWASQMPIFILEDMGELEAAKIELGALLAGDSINDPQERRFLTQRYAELEVKLMKARQGR
ncbi:MAG: hypothetical protein HZA59_02350 [Hydrogenophilales bacterium]|nr:hypothetical protein [Hydrogenophilales bacterium]